MIFVTQNKITGATGAIAVLLIILLCASSVNADNALGDVGSFDKWAKVEILLEGPQSKGSGIPNPFNIFVDVTFSSPAGKTFVVPGFYDGDGKGNLNGDVWKVRFSADEIGTWSFSTQSKSTILNRYSGSFKVSKTSATAPGFYKWGRLEFNGTPVNNIRYMKFRDGPYWLKAGSDDPENFLGGFSHYDTLAKRKAAIDYLASKGINSQYLMTHNIDGDDKDVWPWLGATASLAKQNAGTNSNFDLSSIKGWKYLIQYIKNSGNKARFDIKKLEGWRQIFEYMQTKGVVVYMVLEDDSAWTGYDHGRYYREMLARFGYLPALLFNIGEEANENYSLSESLALARQLKELDPFDHPVGIHNVPLWPNIRPIDAYLDSGAIDFTALQTKGTDPLIHNHIAFDWISRAKSRNRRIPMIGFDEARPILDSRGWWSAYLGGGVWEAHVDVPLDRPLSTWETIWTRLGGARAFMETMPFWEMSPDNSLVVSGTAYVLANPGESYAAYLPEAGSVTLNLVQGVTYTYDWWNPSNGKSGVFQNQGSTGGGRQTFTPPDSGDWALRITRQ